MIEELQRRNFAESTIRSYVHGVEHFSQYFHRRPDHLGPQHIRQYQAMLFSKLKYSPNTVIQRLGALRFFYIKVLKKNWSVAETPYPRKVIRLPEILSPEEVTRLIDAADSAFHRAMLMTLYATGARRAEAAHLKIHDIDSRRMVVHIHGGKGNRKCAATSANICRSAQLLLAVSRLWRHHAHVRTDLCRRSYAPCSTADRQVCCLTGFIRSRSTAIVYDEHLSPESPYTGKAG
jgi:site-specific recombinase XerD